MKRCSLCRCDATTEKFRFAVCAYHNEHGEDDPPCPTCALVPHFQELGSRIFAAHDQGLINENALSTVLQALLGGKALSLVDLMEIFGTGRVSSLVKSTVDRRQHQEREDLFRAAAIAGLSALNPGDGGLATSSIVACAEQTVAELRKTGVL